MPPLATFEYLLETNNPKEKGWGSPRDPTHEVRRLDAVEIERRSVETNLTLRYYSRGRSWTSQARVLREEEMAARLKATRDKQP
jgi:hypothetical protein